MSRQGLEGLLEVSRAISSKLDLGDVLRTVLELSSSVVGAERASLFLIDPKTRELYFDVALGLGAEAEKIRLKVGQGIAGQCAESAEPMIINDVAAHPGWDSRTDKASGFTTRNILAAPLVVREEAIGVVEALNKKQGDFSEDDLKVFEAFARQAGIAIDNARLFSGLREEKRKLEAVFRQMKGGAVLTDPTGRILLSNEAADLLLRTELVPGASLRGAFAEWKVQGGLDAAFNEESGQTVIEAERSEPKRIFLEIEIAKLDVHEAKRIGLTAGWLWMLRDVTAQRVEEGLTRNFLSLISHKIKTPLVSITGYAQILGEEVRQRELPEIFGKALDTIEDQGHHLARLVERLLDFVTLSEAEEEETDSGQRCVLDASMKEAQMTLAAWLERKGATLTRPATIPGTIAADPFRMRTVFQHLIENAVKFNPADGKKVEILVETGGGRVDLRFRDNGPGIPREEHDKVFEKFYQVETTFTGQVEGWGLGLTFVKTITETYGGKVTLESKPGEGTTVTLSFPLA